MRGVEAAGNDDRVLEVNNECIVLRDIVEPLKFQIWDLTERYRDLNGEIQYIV